MSLTEIQIKNAKPQDRRYRLQDNEGLFLDVMSSGSKIWRLRYWLNAKEHTMTLGKYPLISLKDARGRRDAAKKLLQDGIDPMSVKHLSEDEVKKNTFGTVFEEWMTKKIVPVCTDRYSGQVRSRITKHILPYLADTPIDKISSLQLLGILRQIEARGTIDITHRVKQICGQVFRYGIATGVCENDPSLALKGALQSHKIKHQASIIEPSLVGEYFGPTGPLVRRSRATSSAKMVHASRQK